MGAEAGSRRRAAPREPPPIRGGGARPDPGRLRPLRIGRRRAPAEPISWGDLRPARACAWEDSEEVIVLLRPRFGSGRIGRRLQAVFRPSPYRVRLDEFGSFIWRQVDGATSVEVIADRLGSRFGERVAPVEQRLVAFLTSLLRAGFISLPSR